MKLTTEQHNKLALSFFFDTFAAQQFEQVFPEGSDIDLDDDDIAVTVAIAKTIAVEVSYDGEVVDDES